MEDTLFAPVAITLRRDDWTHVRAAAGRLPLRRSIAPRALEAAWHALDAALRASPPGGRRILTLDLARGEHMALLDAARQGALPRLRAVEPSGIRAYGVALEGRAHGEGDEGACAAP